MAMGCLLGEFVDRKAREAAPSVRQELQGLLLERQAGWSVYGLGSSDGEEIANFYGVWPDFARCLGIRPGSAKYKAVTKMWESPEPLICRVVAKDFRRQCTVGNASCYLLSLE